MTSHADSIKKEMAEQSSDLDAGRSGQQQSLSDEPAEDGPSGQKKRRVNNGGVLLTLPKDLAPTFARLDAKCWSILRTLLPVVETAECTDYVLGLLEKAALFDQQKAEIAEKELLLIQQMQAEEAAADSCVRDLFASLVAVDQSKLRSAFGNGGTLLFPGAKCREEMNGRVRLFNVAGTPKLTFAFGSMEDLQRFWLKELDM
ncbi:unnamed protein product [Notodromas monacha]|uniref:Uncharacterized protein n=1 Tax=Notodromas monacha TaxID=399045 RepID=A0A7R9GHF1_9CRUS|nr:unnamed protein product [Notodromas monacha]CAG0920853.1 unnamed protein product [Notodromas monacha]